MKTYSQLVACAKRELDLRYKTYPNWVRSGRMRMEQAAHEIECMAQIVEAMKKLKMLDEITQDLKLQPPLPFRESLKSTQPSCEDALPEDEKEQQ